MFCWNIYFVLTIHFLFYHYSLSHYSIGACFSKLLLECGFVLRCCSKVISPSGTMKCFNTLTWMQPVPPVNKMTWITRTVSEPSWTEKWRDHFWKWFSSVCSPKTFAHLDELCGERHYTDICSWFRHAQTESWREGRGRDVSQTCYMKWKGRSL